MTTEEQAEMRRMLRAVIGEQARLWAEHTAPDDEEFRLLVADSTEMRKEDLGLLLAEAVTMLAQEWRL